MKFLVTGHIKSLNGPKKIIMFCYIFFVVFIVANGYVEILPIYQNNFRISESSWILRLEKFHNQLFFFGMILLFDFSMLLQSFISIRKKYGIWIMVSLVFSLYLFCILIAKNQWFSFLYIAMVMGFHIVILVFQIFLIKDLLLDNPQ